jgi:hypothetical protein
MDGRAEALADTAIVVERGMCYIWTTTRPIIYSDKQKLFFSLLPPPRMPNVQFLAVTSNVQYGVCRAVM